ncbi:MAG: ABC transporter ATP-binding protein [Candidatus Dadabacteria bacterium]
MRINLFKAGKRFNREWIFRNATLEFCTGNTYAITGPNGSGKSTLLQCLGGMLQLSEGSIQYFEDEELPAEKVYEQVSFCAPYLDLVEEMTLTEFLYFHNQFKDFVTGVTIKSIISAIGLQAAADKQIRFYSSGMKQRVKLAQSILSNTGLVLLDEPCSNLDTKGIELYHTLIRDYCSRKLVIVCSNDEVEYSFCNERISITNFKQQQQTVVQ